MLNNTTRANMAEGLCSTCNNQPACMLGLHQQTVWQCEEYYDTVIPPVKTAFGVSASRRETVLSNVRSVEDLTTYKGLCVDCEHRATCMHARTDSGVWHCEDYQ